MKKKTKLKTKKGITLIALIITIAILIIITAVSISAFSDSGLIGKAMNASTNDKNAKLKEELKLAINSNVLKEVTGENTENIESIFQKYAYDGKIKNEDGKRYIQLKENGEKIYLSDYNNEGLVTNGTDGIWSKIKLVCTPKLGEGMKAVYWDENDNEIVQGNENFNIENWYNYKENINNINDSRWANAKTNDGSYWVWIPRYEYKITYYTDSTKTVLSKDNEFSLYGTIDINFISKETKTPTEGYKIHPAFEDGRENNFTNGEWKEELSGIWIAKYEMSHSNATITTEGSGKIFKSIPSVCSAKNEKIKDMYVYSQNYDTNIGNESLDSHLIKNSEWGAVAYLTQSKYGRNGVEVSINGCSSYITGAGPKSSASATSSGYAYVQDIFEDTYSYKTQLGKLASTTGNITGIYDLSGGVWEYVSAYISNGNEALEKNGNTFVNSVEENIDGYLILSTEYVTVYSYDRNLDNSQNNNVYEKTDEKIVNNKEYGYGDAISETKGWNGDNVGKFENSSEPFFLRGGRQDSGITAGIFYSKNYNGSASVHDGFRVVLAF